MGLLVTEDGYYRSWLSVILCCCAAVTNDEHPVEFEKERSKRETCQEATCIFS
jgi:hypothetical protein